MDEFLNAVLLQDVVTNSFPIPHITRANWIEPNVCMSNILAGSVQKKILIKLKENVLFYVPLNLIFVFPSTGHTKAHFR
jgi:hypothetical protein